MTLIILIIITFVMYLINTKQPSWLYSLGKINWDTWTALTFVATGALTVIALIGLTCSHFSYNEYIHKREAVISTIEEARKNPQNYEMASVTLKIIEYNEELAKYKYYNSIIYLEYLHDDRFDKLEPIK